ncbi:MAG: glycosyltransferase family 39 protein [Candidatus Dormibacteraeota bacterium]|nr:glycosyltransferase family 39 protein [Candidatus Dormibacteraeota bacterium]
MERAHAGRSYLLPTGAFVALGLAITLHGLGARPLADFDEALNADIIRSMVRGAGWLVPVFNGTAHLRRPPLYFWLAALSALALHQDSAFAYRLPSAVAGVALAVGLVEVARRRFSLGWAAWGAGLSLVSMPYFLLLSRAAMLDVLAAALSATAILAGSAWLRGRGGRPLAATTGIALGLTALDFSAMVLLPAVFLLADGVWLLRTGRPRWRPRDLWWVILPAIVIGLWWPALMTFWYPHTFLSQFLLQNVVARVTGQVEQHARPIYYYLPLIADGLGAWAPLVAVAMVGSWRRALRNPESLERIALLWLTLGVVGFSVLGTKLPWYVTPVYPACALLAAGYLGRWSSHARDTSVPGRPETLLVAAAGIAGLGIGLWPNPRPVAALLVAGVFGLAAIFLLLLPQPFWRGMAGRFSAAVPVPNNPGRIALASTTLLCLLALGRAIAVPVTIADPGLAQYLQPEPNPVGEAAIATLAARDTSVRLGLLVGANTTLIYYSDRPRVRVFRTVEGVARARGIWVITKSADVAQLRELTPGTVVLQRHGSLTLVALPGAPRHLEPELRKGR